MASCTQPIMNILTVDVESWYQTTVDIDAPITDRVVNNTLRVLDIFEKAQARATFFVLGRVAQLFPDLVREIDHRGHEVATHGLSHRLISDMSWDEFGAELCRSIDVLESITGKKVLGHRGPAFSLRPDMLRGFEIMKKHGLVYDSSSFPTAFARNGSNGSKRFIHKLDGGFWEFPLSTTRILGQNFPIAGGGYFRFLPYALSRWSISSLNRVQQIAVLYFHPYELDVSAFREMQYRDLPLHVRATQSYNRATVPSKLFRLLSDFSFQSIRSYLREKADVEMRFHDQV